jgi:hypothetical protein
MQSTTTIQEKQDAVAAIDLTTVDFSLSAIAAFAASVSLADAASQSTKPAPSSSTVFLSNAAPGVSLVAYGRRLLKYNHCPPMGIMLGVALMARYCRATGHSPNVLSVHRLLLTSVVVALKSHFDIFYSNSYYAQVGGIPVTELNKLEKAFLDGLHFSAMASLQEVFALSKTLAAHGANVPLDKSWAPYHPSRLPAATAEALTEAAAASGRAMFDIAEVPAPFLGARRHVIIPAVPTVTVTPAVSPASAKPDVTPSTTNRRSPASYAARSISASSLEDYAEYTGRSCATSRRPSDPAGLVPIEPCVNLQTRKLDRFESRDSN